ncbi:YjjW family glycine radical enzyme activase [Velocimicrobium porci]|uniref:YjjW family glycine radical enzyme activase n=1 Tax=Velocimicrobium porci TaxID=2606634 RepID=A0A6L5XVR6_9FIRM|nr:YjjW family glycine radical enzyme activase [Velocimicrobium porci]MSS62872.1 YjjW family glycine radical enzyme activase [Velocimicrobium porci]
MKHVGIINKIIPFSAVDGPGCRTAVFFQGCNFNCQYCHNPETISLCKLCGNCVSHCPTGAIYIKEQKVVYEKEKCVECDACLKACPYNSSPKTTVYTPGKLVETIAVNIPFIRGVTFSGGECTLQREFLEEVIPLLSERGLNVLLDSNGTFSFEQILPILEQIEGVMLDIKAFSLEDHIKVTENENRIVLTNAVELAEREKLKEVRTVIVPELFDTKKTVIQTAELLQNYNKQSEIQYKLIKYRPIGVRKEKAIYSTPDTPYMEELKEIVHSFGFKKVTIT